MNKLWLLALLPVVAGAQDGASVQTAASPQEGAVENGARLYRTNCAVPYCHGPNGTAGRAPKLTGHSHTINSMFKVITWGIPGTGMPEFTSRLSSAEIADLVAYLMTLRSTSPTTAAPAVQPRTPTAEAKEGRALFFDSSRMGSCGACHELDGWGVPAGPDLTATPVDRMQNLRSVPQKRVRTARPAGTEPPFPALIAEQTESRVRVYDLTARLPVLRSFPSGGLKLDPNSSWRHEEVTRQYTDAELDKIRNFLRWISAGR